MSSETQFVNGLIVKPPRDGAPEYVKAKLSIKNVEMIAFLQERVARGEEWTNADIKESQGGKWYAAVDNWKPQEGDTSSSGSKGGAPQRERPATATTADHEVFRDDDIPFISSRGKF